MLMIKDFRIEKEDRKVGKKQYMYYRIEGDDTVNNGVTSQEERYSKKTNPKEERWYDVSAFMKTSLKDRPDNVFHNWLKKDKKIYPKNKGCRDVFNYKDLSPEKFENYLLEYAESILGVKSNNPLSPREYQKEGAQWLINFIKETNNKGLLEALPGYGKTFTLYYSLLEAKIIKKVAIITSLKLVKEAFVNDFKKQNLAAKGCALKIKEDGKEEVLGDWNTAEYKMIAAPKFVNSIFKEFTDDPNCLWVQDEAHLGGASQKSTEFYKDKKVLFITGTGNKLFDKIDTHYFFGITAMSKAIKDNPALASVFPIPSIKLITKFEELDFSNLKAIDNSKLEEILDDIVSKSLDNPTLIKNGLVKVGGRYSESAKKLWEVAKLTHPEISWYLAADGKNSESATNTKKGIKGPEAINTFNRDCENEPNKTHILITQFQGKESYSYYDLYNVFYLSESSSSESFIQTFGRLDRPKKHSNATTADFYMYSPFVNFLQLITDEYKRECTRSNKTFNNEDFNDFLRIFKIETDIPLPEELSAEYVLNNLSIHSGLTRNCSAEDWIVLSKYFNEIKDKTNIGIFGNLKKIQKSNKSGKKSAFNTTSTDDDAMTKREKTKINPGLKHNVELIFGRLSYYCKYLEYYKQNPDKIQKKNVFIKAVKDYKYPETIEQLRKLPTYNFKSLVYNFRDTKTITTLFNSLSDAFLENVLVRIIADKNKDLKELPHGNYTPYSNTNLDKIFKEKNNRYEKISEDIFKEQFLPKCSIYPKNGKICLARTSVESVLLLKEQGFSNLTYITDIVAEKFKCDYYGISVEYVRQVNGKEDWLETLKQIAMNYDLIIMNPPYAIGGKVVKAAISHIKDTGEIINLMPLNQYKKDLFKHIQSFELVDPKAFKDAIITPNLNICVLKKNEVNVYTWNQLLLTSFDQNYMEFYNWNIKNNKNLSMIQANYKPRSYFNIDTDFVEVSLCYSKQSGAGFGKNSGGYKFNVLKLATDPKWGTQWGVIKFLSAKAKDNFCKYWYNGKKGESLASRAFLGIHVSNAAADWYMSIPQIDWDTIDTNPLWIAGQYDEAVLDVMGLKWDTNKEKILIK